MPGGDRREVQGLRPIPLHVPGRPGNPPTDSNAGFGLRGGPVVSRKIGNGTRGMSGIRYPASFWCFLWTLRLRCLKWLKWLMLALTAVNRGRPPSPS
jgi:hypothetical protein